MMINVIPVLNEKYNCIENLLASLASYWGIDYYMMSSEVWGFSYKTIDYSPSNALMFGERISPNSGDYFKLFEQYHNTKIDIHSISSLYSIKDLFSVIKSEIEGGYAVIIRVDLFWCPWTKFYKVYNADHYCMVIGINEDNHLLYCIDPLYTLDVIELPILNFEQGCTSCRTLRKLNHNENNIEWRIVLQNAVSHYLGVTESSSTYDAMCNFARDVKSHYHAADEFKIIGEKRLSLLSTQINYIRLARLSFSNFLEMFANDYQIDELNEFSKRMSKFGECWYNLNIMFIKSSYMLDNDLLTQIISNNILELAEQESKFALELQQLVEKYTADPLNIKTGMNQNTHIKDIPINQKQNCLSNDQLLLTLQSEFTEAANTTVRLLVEIWKEVLEKESVGINDNFFDLGGNSLTLVMMHNKVDVLYPNEIDITDIFAYPTISKLATYINRSNTDQEIISNTSLKLAELPMDYFYLENEEDGHALFSKFELEISNNLKRISQKYHIRMTSIFLASYIYLLHDITNQEHISLYFVNKKSRFLLIEINFEEIEDLNDLIETVDYVSNSDGKTLNLANEHTDLQNRVLILFCESDSFYNLPYIENKLILTLSESIEEYDAKLEFVNLNKRKVKEMFHNYIKIVNYIAQNS